MDAGPGTDLGAVGWFIGIWVVMMAAMMFPSIAPMVVMYARIQEGSESAARIAADRGDDDFVSRLPRHMGRGRFPRLRDLRLFQSLDLEFLAWDEGGPYVAGAVIVAAADLSADPAEGRLPAPLSQPAQLRPPAWHPGRLGPCGWESSTAAAASAAVGR